MEFEDTFKEEMEYKDNYIQHLLDLLNKKNLRINALDELLRDRSNK